MDKHIIDNQFLELIEQHKRLVLKICFFYAATEADRQDLFQDIILQAWKSYPSFRNDSKFSTWLYKVSLNTALFAGRKYKPYIQPLPEDLNDIIFKNSENEAIQVMHTAIQVLNEIEKSLVLLYLDGYTYDEMERFTGISSGTLRVKMSRIKQKLRVLVK